MEADPKERDYPSQGIHFIPFSDDEWVEPSNVNQWNSSAPHSNDGWVEQSDGSLLENAVKSMFAPCIGVSCAISECTGPTGPVTPEGRDPSTSDVGRETYFLLQRISRLFRRWDGHNFEGSIIEVPTSFDDISEISAETLEEIELLMKNRQHSFDSSSSSEILVSGSELLGEGEYVTEFHALISTSNWGLLKFRLKQLRWERQCQSPANAARDSTDACCKEPVCDKLLVVDHLGRNPLHLALENDAPFYIIQLLLDLESRAATLPDKNGRYAIHIATRTARTEEEMFKLAAVFPRCLLEVESKGRSALVCSLNQTMHEAEEFLGERRTGQWQIVNEKSDIIWQKDQTHLWRNTNILLSVMLRLKKAIHPKEHGDLIRQAMERGCPPSVVERMLKCSRKNQHSKIFQSNSALCAKCVALVFEFSYPLSVLKGILDAASYTKESPPRKILAALRLGLIEHYEAGFKKTTRNNQNSELNLRDEVIRFHRHHRSRLGRKAGEAGVLGSTNTGDACQQWLDMLSFLLIHTITENPQALSSQHALHVALLNPTSPKSLIELILDVYPESRKVIDPRSGALPLHIACLTDNVNSLDGILLPMVMGEHNSHWVWRRHHDRLPLHHALTNGKNCSFVKQLVRLDRSMLLVRDPVTKLYPFQLAAIGREPKQDFSIGGSQNSSLFQCRTYSSLRWPREAIGSLEGTLSDNRTMKRADDIEQLTNIYELIKMNPDVLGGGSGAKLRQEDESKALDTAGAVSSLCVCWLYDWNKDTGWIISSKNMELAQSALKFSLIPPQMKDFWTEVLSLIWEECSISLGFSQRDDRYILHCALANSDVPPLLIELLVMIFPHAISVPLPGTSIFPVHIAAATPAYVPQDFEVPYPGTSFEILTELTPRNILIDTSNGRSVLHIAIEERKSRDQLCHLVRMEKSLLLTADPETGMLPFHLMALKKDYTLDQTRKLISEARSLSPHVKWATLSTAQKSRFLRKRYEREDRDCLSTLFDFIRAEPSVIEAVMQEDEKMGPRHEEKVMNHFMFEESKGHTCGDTKLVELVLREFQSNADSPKLEIEYSFRDDYSFGDHDADSQNDTGAVEMVVREDVDSASVESNMKSECVHDMLLVGCARWRDVGMLLEQAMCQHNRVSSQITQSKMVLEMYDERIQKK
eukprot:scaffold1992_cov113-Cylindrotheca_fusiformis.AAC.3